MVTYAKADRHVIILALVQAMQAWFLLVKFPQWQVAAMDFVRRRSPGGCLRQTLLLLHPPPRG